jgi:hypothetical protein
MQVYYADTPEELRQALVVEAYREVALAEGRLERLTQRAQTKVIPKARFNEANEDLHRRQGHYRWLQSFLIQPTAKQKLGKAA